MRNARYHLSRIGGDTRLRVLEMGDDATGRADVWAHLGETFAVASVSDGQDRAATMVQSRNLVVGLQKTEADVFVLRAGANDLLGHGRLARVLGNVDPGAGVAIDAPAHGAAAGKALEFELVHQADASHQQTVIFDFVDRQAFGVGDGIAGNGAANCFNNLGHCGAVAMQEITHRT